MITAKQAKRLLIEVEKNFNYVEMYNSINDTIELSASTGYSSINYDLVNNQISKKVIKELKAKKFKVKTIYLHDKREVKLTISW